MQAAHVQVPQTELEEFCRQNAVRRFALFGSVLTDRFSESSDVDVLVEFNPGARVGYLRMAAMERETLRVFWRPKG